MKTYTTLNGVTILICQNPYENEEITMRYKKSTITQILWFHTVEVPGFVGILIPNDIEDMTNDDIQLAADLVAQNSENYKNESKLKVCYSNVKMVYKTQNNPTGSFMIDKYTIIDGHIY